MSTRYEVSIVLNAVDRASGALRELGNSVSRLGDKLSTLKDIGKIAAGVLIGEVAQDALGALTDALGDASRNFVSLESTLVSITAAMGKTGAEAERLRQEFLEVASQQTDLGFTAAEAALALESLVKAGLEGEQATKALRAALEMARIEGISTEQAANLLVATLNQFGMTAEETARALDVLINASMVGIDAASDFAHGLSYVGTVANMMGLSIEEVTAGLVALNNAGINASSAGRYLASMLTDMINKSDKLGFSLYNTDGSMKSLTEIVQLLTQRLESFGTQVERDAYLTSIFGEQGRRAAAVLVQQSEGFSELVAQMGQAGSAMMMVNEIMNTTEGRMARVNAETANATLEFGQLTAGVQEAFASFTTFLGPLAQVAQGLGPSLLQGAITGVTMALPQLVTNIGAVSAAFSSMGGLISTSIIPLLTNPLTAAIAGVVLAAVGLYMAWENNWFGIRDVTANVVSALQNIWAGFTSWMSGALEGFVSFFKEHWLLFGPMGFVYKAWEQNWFGIRDLFNTITERITSGLTWFTGEVQAGWSSLTSWMTANIPPALDTVKNAFISGLENIGWAVIDFVDQAKGVLGGFLSWLDGVQNNIESWMSGVSRAFGNWARGIKEWWSSVTEALKPPKIPAPKPALGVEEEEVPEMQHGGVVQREGLYWLHPGEIVVPPSAPINVTINMSLVGAPGMDVRQLAEEAARRIERRLRSVLIEPTSHAAPTKQIRLVKRW